MCDCTARPAEVKKDAMRRLGHLRTLIESIGKLYDNEVMRGEGPIPLEDMIDLAESIADEVYLQFAATSYHETVHAEVNHAAH